MLLAQPKEQVEHIIFLFLRQNNLSTYASWLKGKREAVMIRLNELHNCYIQANEPTKTRTKLKTIQCRCKFVPKYKTKTENKKLELCAWRLDKRSKASQDARVHITGFFYLGLFFRFYSVLVANRRVSWEERSNSIYRVSTSRLFSECFFLLSLWFEHETRSSTQPFALKIIKAVKAPVALQYYRDQKSLIMTGHN